MRSMVLLVCIVAVFSWGQQARAITIHVPGDYPSIGAALGAASYGDTVLVAPGTYVENLTLPNGIVLISSGGAGVTTIDGGYAGTVVSVYSADANTVMAGFTIQRGMAPEPQPLGGGMYLNTCDMKIRDNVFTDNHAISGGGIFVEWGGNAEIFDNVFEYNQAGSGAGLYIQGADTAPWVHGNTFMTNVAEWGGGAICHRAGPHPEKEKSDVADIDGNIIKNNQAVLGGGIYLLGEWAELRVHGNTFSWNHAMDLGGGMCADYSLNPMVWNNTFEHNTCEGCGAAMVVRSSAASTFENNTVRNNTASLCGGGLYAEFSGNMKIDRNRFVENTAQATHGGGLYVYMCQAIIEWNLFAHNWCGHRGGGIVWAFQVDLEIRNNTLVGNHALEGGGIYIADSISATIENNIVAGSTGGYGMYLPVDGDAVLACNDVWNNQPADYYDIPPGAGDFSEDPLFCDPVTGNFMLDCSSPCVHGYGCGLVGAFGQGCGATRVESKSWGSLKALYR